MTDSGDRMTDSALTIEALMSRVWSLSRADGTVICPKLRLSGLGDVLGFRSFAENGWRLAPDLEFLDQEGRPTTRFTQRGPTADGGIMLSGPFLDHPAVTHVLQEVDPKPSLGARVAVMVRAHNASEKLFALLDTLSQGSGFDLFLAADETRQVLDAGRYRKEAHSEAMCAELGLMRRAPMRSLLWYFGDYAFYCFFSRQPNYDHYLMIEYDVGMSRASALAVEALAHKLVSSQPTIDLSASYLHRRDASWMWSEQCGRRYGEVHGLFFPIVSLSRDALTHLFEARRREAADPTTAADPLFCESFVPSCLRAADQFRTADLNQVLNNAYEHGTFGGGNPIIVGDERFCGSKAEFFHPVFSLDEYTRRVIDCARDVSRNEELYALLGGLYRGSDEAAPHRLARLGRLRC